MSAMFQEAFVKHNEVFVTVSAKNHAEFVQTLAAESTIRRTKRFNAKNIAARALFHFVREERGLKGKHVHIHVLTSAGKEGLFRNEKGRFVKITDEFTRVTK